MLRGLCLVFAVVWVTGCTGSGPSGAAPCECPAGQACDAQNRCRAICGDPADCGACELCADGWCVSGCSSGQKCETSTNSCVNDDTGGGGDDDDTGDPPADCENSSECNDGNPCTDNTCVDGSCVTTNNSQPCDDGIACTTGDVCVGGQCAGTPNDSQCNDLIPCTWDLCAPDDEHANANGCVHPPDDGLCDDGKSCTDNTCEPGAGGCVRTLHDDRCNDGVTCTTDSCNPDHGAADAGTGCRFEPNHGACEGSNTCMAYSCDPVAGCQATPVANFTPCNDGNSATSPDYCFGGTCRGAGSYATNPYGCGNVVAVDMQHVVVGAYKKYLGVLNSDRQGCSVSTAPRIVHVEVTPPLLNAVGATAEGYGSMYRDGYIVGSSTSSLTTGNYRLGRVDMNFDTGAVSVTWSGTDWHDALDGDAALTGFTSVRGFGVGLHGMTPQAWFGATRTTGSHLRRCSGTTCDSHSSPTGGSTGGIYPGLGMVRRSSEHCDSGPWGPTCTTSWHYDGGVIAVNTATNALNLYRDAGIDGSYAHGTSANWLSLNGTNLANGMAVRSNTEVVVYGKGGLFTRCGRNAGMDDWTCSPVSVTKWDNTWEFVDVEIASNNQTILVLARHGGKSYAFYIPDGASPHTNANWHGPIELGTIPGVAIAGESTFFRVLGNAPDGKVQVWSVNVAP